MDYIEGVMVQPCKRVNNERGFLQEIIGDKDAIFTEFGQTYITLTHKDIVKAWYLHKVQIDYIFVIKGVMCLTLYDQRPDSVTYKKVNEIIIDANDPKIVKIPPGLWHGFKALQEDLLLLHVNSKSFDFNNMDEERLPNDSSLIPYSFSNDSKLN